MNTPKGVLGIHNPLHNHILLDNDLTDFLGMRRYFQTINLIKRFPHSPTTLLTVIFWIRMKMYSMESPQMFLDTSKLSVSPLTG